MDSCRDIKSHPVTSSRFFVFPEKSELPTSNIWPPPEGKGYMQQLKGLPSNIRMAAPEDVKSEMVKAHPGPSGDGQGQGQPGSHGYSNVSQENVLTSGSASDIPSK